MSMQLTSKPTDIEAVVYTGENLAEIQAFALEACSLFEETLPVIESLQGSIECEPGMVLIQHAGGLEIHTLESLAAGYEAPAELVASMEKHWNKAQRDDAPASDWAVPEKKKLRIDDKKHVQLAWAMVDRTKDLSEAERAKARRRILAKAKKLKMDTSEWEKKGVSLEDIDYAVEVDILPPPVVPGPSDGIAYLMDHAAEEAGELVQALIHGIRYGIDSVDPKRADKSPRQQIQQEMNDLLAAVQILNDELEGRGVAPIQFGAGNGLEQVVDERLASLKVEFEAGRYTLPAADAE